MSAINGLRTTAELSAFAEIQGAAIINLVNPPCLIRLVLKEGVNALVACNYWFPLLSD